MHGGKASRPGDKPRGGEKKPVRAISRIETTTNFVETKWNVCCLPLMAVLLLVLGTALIVVAAVKYVPDLYLLGAIFIVGGILFFLIMYVSVCKKYCRKNSVKTYEHELVERPQPAKAIQAVQAVPSEPTFGGYINRKFDSNEDLLEINNRFTPTEDQLYAKHARAFLATPATSKDVRFESPPGTPPPPRIALPAKAGDKSRVVYDSDTEQRRTPVDDVDLL